MTLHVSDSTSVHHQESSTVHTAVGIGHTGYVACQRDQEATEFSITCMAYTYCCVYSARLLMMDKDTVRNMQSHILIINLRNQCISLVLLQEQNSFYVYIHLQVNAIIIQVGQDIRSPTRCRLRGKTIRTQYGPEHKASPLQSESCGTKQTESTRVYTNFLPFYRRNPKTAKTASSLPPPLPIHYSN